MCMCLCVWEGSGLACTCFVLCVLPHSCIIPCLCTIYTLYYLYFDVAIQDKITKKLYSSYYTNKTIIKINSSWHNIIIIIIVNIYYIV